MKTNWGTGIDMRLCRRLTIVIVFITCCMALPASGEQYFLYSPQSAKPDQSTASPEGILVREIKIQKGDTLSGLSRKFSGHAMYFPQILLFNSIKNPDLIYSGKMLKVPVLQTGQTATPSASPAPADVPAAELSLSELKTSVRGKSDAKRKNTGAAPKAGKKSLLAHPPVAPTASLKPLEVKGATAASGQKLFEAATKAYQQNDVRTALELFDRFLTANPGSPLTADANLYKAECYLKLSAQ
jgi:hypothetical protein